MRMDISDSRILHFLHRKIDNSGRLLAAGQVANDLHFALTVWRAVRVEDVVEPDRWRVVDVRMLP